MVLTIDSQSGCGGSTGGWYCQRVMCHAEIIGRVSKLNRGENECLFYPTIQ